MTGIQDKSEADLVLQIQLISIKDLTFPTNTTQIFNF